MSFHISPARVLLRRGRHGMRALLARPYERSLIRGLENETLPGHVAIMADGNRRWARASGFTTPADGHRAGALKIVELVGWCEELGIGVVTIYLLSTENLQRDPRELEELLPIIADVVDALSEEETEWCVRLVGAPELLPEAFAQRLSAAAERTAGRSGPVVNVAVGYGGRQEIVSAVQELLRERIAEGATGEELVAAVTDSSVSAHLYTSGQPDPDLVIRTSGEQRLSGFLLWQSAYSEIWFTDAYWPDFRRVDFLRALRSYTQRSRRFGR